MEALDGNAIAGSLYEYFGAEMTTAEGRCKHCGARGLIAELHVYTRAPGSVGRCRNCGNVVMVVVQLPGATRVHADAFELAESS